MLYRVLRCQFCNRKLAEANGTFGLCIKCPKCKNINRFTSV
ncbi:phage FluMu protein Com [Neisseria sp. HSC-16F19]|nr:Com family DNA-binding transcriptional regulator [Neisseria sp. HSC-16F19]MCP2041032.1 phage FluMu protein Com [Neisseria sp. HSC-16F19]